MLKWIPCRILLYVTWHQWGIVTICGRSEEGSIYSERELAMTQNRFITWQLRALEQLFETRQSTFHLEDLALSQIHSLPRWRTLIHSDSAILYDIGALTPPPPPACRNLDNYGCATRDNSDIKKSQNLAMITTFCV